MGNGVGSRGADGVRRRQSVIVGARGASDTIFWQPSLISPLFMLLSLHPGMRDGVCVCFVACVRARLGAGPRL